MRALAVVVALAAASGVADARNWRRLGEELQGGAYLHYELTALTVAEDSEPATRAHELVLAGARLHGFVARNRWIAYHVGLDLAGGSTARGAGFAYDVALFPIGAVVRLGSTSFVGVSGGVGALGAVGRLDDALALPVEAFAELGGGIRVLARARATYVKFSDGLRRGAPSLGYTDALDAMLGLRLGHHFDDYGFPTGNGYFVGASYRELGGAKYVGVTIGYSIDLASRRRHRTDDEPVAQRVRSQ
jgi:hypothetical protein